MKKPSRHEHEQGAPIHTDCCNRCKEKYERWSKDPDNVKLQIRANVLDEVIRVLDYSCPDHATMIHLKDKLEKLKATSE